MTVANGRNKNNKGDSGRMAGGFIALPWGVVDCPAYASLSHPARSLLTEIARQYVRDNNGRLLASGAYLAKRGWRSNDVIVRAKRELVEAGFIHEMVMGHRPNKASWYAITWQRLDKIPGYDPGAAETFRRGAFQNNQPLKKSLTPSHGVERASIAPSHGVGSNAATPSHGAMRPILTPTPTPSHGDHLEKPSVAVGNGDVLATVSTSAAPAFLPATGTSIPPTQRESTSGSSTTLADVVAAECDEVAALVGADDGEDF